MKKTGKFLNVPYDWSRPSRSLIRERMWNRDDPRVFTPHVFGWGWSINLYQVLQRLHLVRDA